MGIALAACGRQSIPNIDPASGKREGLSKQDTKLATQGRDVASGDGSGKAGTQGLPKSGGKTKAPQTGALIPLACVPSTAAPSNARVWRLGEVEFEKTAAALLGASVKADGSFLESGTTLGFNNNADDAKVGFESASALFAFSDDAAAAIEANVTKFAPCKSGRAQKECATDFIRTFGANAWRRPLTEKEVTKLSGLYTVGANGRTHADGVALAAQGILNSPKFLYRSEIGEPEPGNPARRRLTDYELASALSYTYVQSPPDADLLAAAKSGRLQDSAARLEHARRLMAQSDGRQAFKSFVRQWLELDMPAAELMKDTATYPKFTKSIASKMDTELDRYLDHIIGAEDGSFEKLLTAPYTFVDKELASYYDLPAVAGNGFEQVKLDPNVRGGVLMLGSFLARKGLQTRSDPVHRGVFVREKIQCAPLPAPPANVNDMPSTSMAKTTRELFASHSSNPACVGCHIKIDGVGFPFENFDGVGRWRATENGIAIDASGRIMDSPGQDGDVNGAPELVRRLATSSRAQECAVRQVFRYLNGRGEEEKDGCQINTWNAEFASKDSLTTLFLSASGRPEFALRSLAD